MCFFRTRSVDSKAILHLKFNLKSLETDNQRVGGFHAGHHEERVTVCYQSDLLPVLHWLWCWAKSQRNTVNRFLSVFPFLFLPYIFPCKNDCNFLSTVCVFSPYHLRFLVSFLLLFLHFFFSVSFFPPSCSCSFFST